ncbi:hypothetical protein AB0M22_15440 [Nocardia sp. NPDC051756]|uniref:hypothetical protein n=1 Tax=Nocardia sp. NPDC051756 TaxID=3154751 RepID=UPI00342C0776
MTAAFDDMDLPALVRLLTEDEQRDLRPVVLRLVASHGQPVEQHPATPARRLSFAGTVEAAPDFATTSQEVLRRELGGGA